MRAGWGIVRTMSDRLTSSQRGYGSRWQKAREGYLRSHPLCRECEKQGKLTPATVVDHIIPHKGDQGLFWDKDNWGALCKPCHDAKTAREDGGFGNKASTKPRQGCTVDGWPTSPEHVWNKVK